MLAMTRRAVVAKRAGNPTLSAGGQSALAEYAYALHHEQDLSADTRRNYLSDLRQFAAWCEGTWGDGQGDVERFAPAAVTTPTIPAYRAHLQAVARLAPATSNRHLVSLKRYCAWACDRGLVALDPARPVKLVPRVPTPPRHLSDKEEAALLAVVTAHGTPRDRTLLVTALHTGLRAEELCNLQRADLAIAARSGQVTVYGKRNKYREMPLNSTARAALGAWLATLPPDTACLFPSRRGGGQRCRAAPRRAARDRGRGGLRTGVRGIVVAIGIASVPDFARIARAAAISERERDYVAAAHAIGASPGRIMRRHVLPNVVPPLLIQLSVALSFAVLLEAGLSFLGLGIQPPQPSWGSMLQVARTYLYQVPSYTVVVGLALSMLLIGFNFIADALRDILDPRLNRELR